MLRSLAFVVGLCGLLAPRLAADDALERVLKKLPDDTVGFLAVPSISALDENLHVAINKLGMAEHLPAPMNSLAGALRTMLRMSEGLDEKGPLVAVMLAAETIGEAPDKLALLAPVTDGAALLKAMGAEPGEGGVWSLALMGKPVSAVAEGDLVALAPSSELARRLAKGAGGKSLYDRMGADDRTALHDLNLALWVDSERVVELARPQIDSMIGMITMMQAAGGPIGAGQAQSTREQMEMYLDGTRSVVFGAWVKPVGLGIRFAMSAKPGSEFAKLMQSEGTDQTLLSGLPRGAYMLAMGQTIDHSGVETSLKGLDPYFEVGKDNEDLDADALAELKSATYDLLRSLRAVRLSVDALPSGPDGLIGLTLLLDTPDSGKAQGLITKVSEAAKRVCKDAELLPYFDALTHELDVEEMADVKVSRFKYDLSKVDELDEDDREEMLKIIGQEGLALRIAAVSDKRLAIAFGGGKERMSKVIAAAKSDDPALAEDAGVRRAAEQLPKTRASELYLALDEIGRCAQNIAKAIDEDPLPLDIPDLDAPVAMVSVASKACARLDIFVPMELAVACKDAAMSLMGMPGASPTSQQSTSAEAATGSDSSEP